MAEFSPELVEKGGGFFYVEWTGKPCPFCGEDGVSGKSPAGHFFAGCPESDCLAHNLAYDFVTVDHARAAWDTRALEASGHAELVEALGMALDWPMEEQADQWVRSIYAKHGGAA